MDADQVFAAIPTVNNLSVAIVIGCVVPTYFLRLDQGPSRWILALAIVSGLSTLVLTLAGASISVARYPFLPLYFVLVFSPLNLVLIAMLACIRRLNRVVVWSTVVLACAVIDWAGISLLVLALT
ncbi:hypothetical protein [Bradyrhizobium sp. SRS-191]|uniref:hypothetical protein n=1 Tax=Bradyrhizobium sp. SRS-191 TaxID=2962606 RepID=UPI00211EE2E6|nr:hypothetical protein [Bradyrhizobium sp. SRS-191]